MDEDTGPQDVFEQAIEDAAPEIEAEAEDSGEQQEQEQPVERQVPVSAVQKERKKRQDAEAREQRAAIELQYLKEQYSQRAAQPQEEDETQYESATKAELNQSASKIKQETIRDIKEDLWAEANPEKKAMVDENLSMFLKQRPNLATAISSASNRYSEAYLLMTALSPKQQEGLRPQAVKKPSPGSPNGVPKAASLNQAVDVMSMSDDEYRKWRQSKSTRGR
jgi:hypothetical protein